MQAGDERGATGRRFSSPTTTTARKTAEGPCEGHGTCVRRQAGTGRSFLESVTLSDSRREDHVYKCNRHQAPPAAAGRPRHTSAAGRSPPFPRLPATMTKRIQLRPPNAAEATDREVASKGQLQISPPGAIMKRQLLRLLPETAIAGTHSTCSIGCLRPAQHLGLCMTADGLAPPSIKRAHGHAKAESGRVEVHGENCTLPRLTLA